MKTTADKATEPTFEKVGDVHNLYRYAGNSVYYALVRHKGKLHKKSLETDDKAAAKRKLADFQRDLGKVDASQGKLTLRELAERYLLTIASQAADTIALKTTIVNRLLSDFVQGGDVQVAKVKPSDLQAWLASYKRWDDEKQTMVNLGYSSYNHHLQVVKAIFAIAVADKVIVVSPAAELKGKKVVTPICVTPTFEEFVRIVADIRQQKCNAESNASADLIEFMGL